MERQDRVESIFHAALERPPEQREPWTRQACGSDRELYREVTSLLANHATSTTSAELWMPAAAARLIVEPEPLEAGQRLRHYNIVSFIAAGGMGRVYRAHDPRIGRDVAIKVVAGGISDRFSSEVKAAGAINHPNICQIYDVGHDYIVMELVEGPTLAELIRRGSISSEEVLEIALQIAQALSAAHEKGILHCDLKPGNINIRPDGMVKVLDFGLAKRTEESAHTAGGLKDGGFYGTPGYMSPEQAQGKALDVRSDIFCFGLTLYEMLSGRRPFKAFQEDLSSNESEPFSGEPEPLNICAGIADVVMRCLKKEPNARFQSMAEVLAALRRVSGEPDDPQQSIAVLPFAELSGDRENEYFSDGLSEEIINALTHVPGLKVTARASAFAFKGKNEDIRKIARALGVTNVLEGSVRRAGSRLRVTVELIHAADGTHLWSERYDRELTDLFALQDEISAAIVGTLRVKMPLSGATARPHEPTLRAYEAFLKGKQYQHHRAFKTVKQQIARIEEYFNKAIVLDPHWADPHSALGSQHFFLAALGWRPPSETIPLARAEAWKALELLPSEPVAHGVLGAIAAVHDFDWKEAEKHFKLARTSESVSPSVHHMYASFYLSPLGRFEEALRHLEKGLAQDPLNMIYRGYQLITLLFAEMYERAIAAAQELLEFDNRSIVADSLIALAHFFQENLGEAREWAEEACRRTPQNPLAVGLMAGVLKQSGEKNRAEKLLATGLLKQSGEEEHAKELLATPSAMSTLGMIIYHLVCSEIDAAIDWYEHAIEQRQTFAAEWASAGFFRPLRSSRRWLKLAKMMNLPQSARSFASTHPSLPWG